MRPAPDGGHGGAARAAVAAAMAWFALAAAGCDECDFGQVICRDNQVWTCTGASAPLQWSRKSCGDKLCQVATLPGMAPKGLCAAEAMPNPACAVTTVRGEACADGRVVACDSGFVIRVDDACAAPDLCVPTPIPFCALSLAPDPRCALANVPAAAHDLIDLCSAGHHLSCAYPSQLIAEDRDCGGEELCYTEPSSPGSSRWANCVVSRTPDPRCADPATTKPAPGFSALCDVPPRQDILLRCLNGLLTSSRDCGVGACVHEAGLADAMCRGDTGPSHD